VAARRRAWRHIAKVRRVGGVKREEPICDELLLRETFVALKTGAARNQDEGATFLRRSAKVKKDRRSKLGRGGWVKVYKRSSGTEWRAESKDGGGKKKSLNTNKK